MARVGVIAGKGNLPVIWSKAAREKGHTVIAFPLKGVTDSKLDNITQSVEPVNPGQLGRLIEQLLKKEINEVVMIGKIEKSMLFQGLDLDQRMKSLLSGLKILNDDSIMLAIVNELAQEGIEVLKQSTYIEDLFPQPGVLTSKEPVSDLIEDMEYGFNIAKEIGRLDIGQTVIVKGKAVMAVEAIEGTDSAILRGGELGGPGVTMAKVSKPQQDFRFDIPTVGETTLDNLIKIGARGLVIEAGKTFLINKEEFIARAEKANITVVAMEQ